MEQIFEKFLKFIKIVKLFSTSKKKDEKLFDLNK